MTKANYRQQMLAFLKKQPQDQKARRDQELIAALLAHSAYARAKVLATYLPFPHEVDTSSLILAAQADGKHLVVPKIRDREMVFASYEPDKLEKTAFGLWEPVGTVIYTKEQIDLIHVPGLLFNQSGYRIGYGGGYYDRYLADFAGQTISTAYPEQVQEFQADCHDIPVQEVLIAHDSI